MMHTIIKYILIFSLIFFISSCWKEEQKDTMSLWKDGIHMNVQWDSISIDENGIRMDIDGNSMSFWEDGIRMDIDGDKINVSAKEMKKMQDYKSLWDDFSSFDEIDYNDTEDSIQLTSCTQEYNILSQKYGKNYDDCYFNKPEVNSCKWSIDLWEINIAIILDSSWSMGATIWGETMMEIAKEKLQDYISDIEHTNNISFILYGHKWSSQANWEKESCQWVEVISDFSTTQKDVLRSRISGLQPNGWTPIESSLQVAKSLISKQAKPNDKNIILLVSDGKETCWGDPVSEAKIISEMQNTYIDVIWFNVWWSDQQQLMNIAKYGNGNYYDVKSRLDFDNTFNKTKNFLDTLSCGASKAAIELEYWAAAINKYYSCMYRLKEEEIFMMTESSKDCKSYTQMEFDTKYNKYEREFESIRNTGEEILDNFTKHIETLEDQFK